MPMTRDERRERRKQIAESILAGQSIPETARRFGVTASAVYSAMREYTSDVSFRDRRAFRNKSISEAIASGETLPSVCARFKAPLQAVRNACLENGVKPPSYGAKIGDKSWRILARLFNQAETFEQIGLDFDITRQRVGQIYQKAVNAGIPLPVRPNNSIKVSA